MLDKTVTTIQDNSQAEFDQGAYTGTSYYLGSSAVGLNLPQTAGIYTSAIHDTGVVANWGTFSWIPNRPMNKELPDNGQSETAYTEGNATMSGNVLLLHMNDGVSGAGETITDTSGHNDHGITYGNPNCTATGKFNGSCDFPGGTNYVSMTNLDVNIAAGASNTVEFWMYWRGGNGQMPFGWSQAYDLWFSGGCFGFNTGESNVFGVQSTGLANRWVHVAAVFYNGVPSAGTVKLYLDGQERTDIYACLNTTSGSRLATTTGQISGWALGAGYYFGGVIDEFAMYNRALSASEVADHYRRGALRLRFDARSCDDANCNGESFVGGYSEADNADLGLPAVGLVVGNNRYFQYRATFETDDVTISPELGSVSVEYTGSTGGELTASSCLDLSGVLAPTYVVDIPYDPQFGSEEKTMYGVRKTPGGRIYLQACNAEYEDEITLSR
ncbi:MAG: LamG domain-containing protein [bacterium]